MVGKLWIVIIMISISYYLNHSIYDIIANFGVYFPFINITTYLDFMRYVIIPKFRGERNSEKLFTVEELKWYNGENGEQLFISIFGNVFEVTNGASYYGVGQVYHGFTGRDASRAFITGDFTEEGLVDDVLDLSLPDLRHLKEWLKMYQNKYSYKGKLIGRYFDSYGKPTAYNVELKKRILEAGKDKDFQDIEKHRFPPCNVEWSADKGSRVWCTTQSGGIERDWIGVPRKLYLPGSKSYRCACVNNISLQSSSTNDHEIPKFLVEYEECDPNAHSCYIKT